MRCIRNGIIKWEARARCLEHGKWSPLPTCKSTQRVGRGSLEPIDCKRLPVNIQGQAFCVKVKLPKERKCPQLIQVKMDLSNCSREVNSECIISCGDTSMNIVCHSNGQWSPLPTCKPSRPIFCPEIEEGTSVNCSRRDGEKCNESLILNHCPKPTLPKTLIFSEDCHSKRAGDSCQIECLNSEEKFEITCFNNTHWSSLPQCSCPQPSFSNIIEIKDNCSAKKPGEKCKVACKNVPNLKKHMYVICQNNSRWSDEPLCERVVCPKPTLPSYLLFNEDCTNKSNRQRCKLLCKMGGKFVNHTGSIRCVRGKRWSRLPVCTCPIPYIREDLESVNDCTAKKPGEKCMVKCKENLLIPQNESIICQDNTTWTVQPLCTQHFCSTPKLPSSWALKQNCSFKLVGDECELLCKGGGNTNTKNAIHCLKSLEWSPLPVCEEKFCPTPNLSFLKFKSDCSSISIGGMCELNCSQGGYIIGNKSITCHTNLTWSSYPTCTCPKPTLKGDLYSENCTFKIPGEKCNIKCKNDFFRINKSFILCNSDSQWSSQPTCIRAKCRNLIFSSLSVYSGKCVNMSAGDTCYLNCKNGGKFLRGQNQIVCSRNGKWTRPRMCSCPALVPPEEYVMKEDCSEKFPGEPCHLACKNGAEFKDNQIRCNNMTNWSKFPACVKSS